MADRFRSIDAVVEVSPVAAETRSGSPLGEVVAETPEARVLDQLAPTFKKAEKSARRLAIRNFDEFGRDAANRARANIWRVLREPARLSRAIESLDALARKATTNAAIDLQREERQWRERFVSMDDPNNGRADTQNAVERHRFVCAPPAANPEQRLLEAVPSNDPAHAAMRRAFSRLRAARPVHARVVELRIIEGWGREAVAAHLVKSVANVDQMLHRGKERLGQYFAEEMTRLERSGVGQQKRPVSAGGSTRARQRRRRGRPHVSNADRRSPQLASEPVCRGPTRATTRDSATSNQEGPDGVQSRAIGNVVNNIAAVCFSRSKPNDLDRHGPDPV